jgi:drug/metabolite transporter (DMT)-like permease
MSIPVIHIVGLIAYATLMATGNLVLEAAATRIAQANTLYETVLANASNVFIWLGLAIYAFSFVLWIWLLSFIPLRYAYPIAATSIVIAPLLSGLIYRSFPQPLYWVGLVLVTVGLSLVATR